MSATPTSRGVPWAAKVGGSGGAMGRASCAQAAGPAAEAAILASSDALAARRIEWCIDPPSGALGAPRIRWPAAPLVRGRSGGGQTRTIGRGPK